MKKFIWVVLLVGVLGCRQATDEVISEPKTEAKEAELLTTDATEWAIKDIMGWSTEDGHYEYTSYWRDDGVVNVGNKECSHQWVYSKNLPSSNMSCGVIHYDGICSWNFPRRHKICKSCGAETKEIEITESEWVKHPKTEYEKVKEKFTKEVER